MTKKHLNYDLQHGQVGLKAWFGLLYARDSLVEAVDKALVSQHELPLSWFEVLLRLAACDAQSTENTFLSVSNLAKEVLLSPSRVSRVVDGLHQRGLVIRRQSTADARVTEVALTEAGMSLFQAANATHCQVINDRFLSRLSTQEVEVLVKVWQEIGITYSQ